MGAGDSGSLRFLAMREHQHHCAEDLLSLGPAPNTVTAIFKTRVLKKQAQCTTFQARLLQHIYIFKCTTALWWTNASFTQELYTFWMSFSSVILALQMQLGRFLLSSIQRSACAKQREMVIYTGMLLQYRPAKCQQLSKCVSVKPPPPTFLNILLCVQGRSVQRALQYQCTNMEVKHVFI